MKTGRTHESPFDSSLTVSASMASTPSRMDSSERDILPSWADGSRLRDMALCRSKSESFIWSARR